VKTTGISRVRASRRSALGTVALLALIWTEQAMGQDIYVPPGEVSGPVSAQHIRNDGTIEGGAVTAATATGGDPTSGGASIFNFGLISSTSAAPTVRINGGNQDLLFNSGTIRNGGSGAAILAQLPIFIHNETGGLIESAGGVAITSVSWMNLTNGGTIIGDVVGSMENDVVTLHSLDTLVPGTINGSVLLGAGDDYLTNARVDPVTGLLRGVTGTVDGGAGHDVFGLGFDGNGAVGRVIMPTGFEQLQIAAANDQVITLGPDYQGPSAFIAAGTGTIDIQTTLTGTGPLIDSSMGQTTLRNGGTIAATGLSAGEATILLGPASRLENSGTISAVGGSAVRDEHSSRIINSGTITGKDGIGVILADSRLDNSGTISGDVAAIIAGLGTGPSAGVTINNSGTITSAAGPAILTNSFTTIFNDVGGVISGGGGASAIARTEASSFSVSIVNSGLIEGSIDMTLPNAPNPASTSYMALAGGLVTGAIRLGDADNDVTVEVKSGATNLVALGGISGGAGNDRLRYQTVETGTAHFPNLSGFELIELGAFSADASLRVEGAVSDVRIETIGTGAVTLSNQARITGQSSVLAMAPRLFNQGLIDVTSAGDAVVIQPGSVLENSGTIRTSGASAISLASAPLGTRAVIRNAASGLIQGATAIRLLDPCDSCSAVEIENAGTITGTVDLRADDRYGSSYAASGLLSGDLLLGGGADIVLLTNGALVDGSIRAGTGDDNLEFRGSARATGVVDGGAGNDRLVMRMAGSAAAPDRLDLSRFINIESATFADGFGTLAGTAGFDRITVFSGGLFGLAGSVITAPAITVSPGATFGSAGTVNGNISVSGTLAPGASPGTMTVNGSVSLAAGSVTLFEMTPTVSDKLVINGALTIAPNATLTVTGNRPLTPGLGYSLITTSGGITGSYATINQAAGVAGFIRQDADSIDLFGLFMLNPQVSDAPQAGRTIAYLNALLVDGTATAAMLAASPTLVDGQGYADTAKFRRLTPEAYASAAQIGIENGLAIASAARGIRLADGRDQSGIFSFGQAFGNWRNLPGSAARGTARADLSTRGLLVGIGVGSSKASIGAFLGYIDAKQRIGAIGAATDSDGLIAGAIGQVRLGGFDVSALAGWDGSKADTRRALPVGGTATSRYALRGWTIDARIGYAADIGNGWQLRPEIGLTHIASKRHGATEAGGSPFALAVDGGTVKATFADAALTLRAGAEAKIQPWLSAGLRHQLSGEDTLATAAFVGVTRNFTVPGVVRDRTQATVAAGLGAAISPSTMLIMGVSGEFGSDSSGQGANAALKVRF
jgi:uncharacterized protein with beta-barrel porin domain